MMPIRLADDKSVKTCRIFKFAKISNDYIQKVLRTYDDIDQQGVETLILAQELTDKF